MDEKKIPLPGDLVKDRISGLTGIVTSRTQYLNMCDRYGVQPQVEKGDKKLPTAYSIDVGDLIIMEENAIKASPEERARWGEGTDGVQPENGGPPEPIERPR